MRTIYHNGKIFTGELPLKNAFVVEDGEFIYVGDSADALSMAGAEDFAVDLNGKFACAGFVDSHMHLLSFGKALSEARLSQHTGSLRELIDYFRDYAHAHPPRHGGWIIGRGWNQDYFDDCNRMPDRHDLDRVSDKYPVIAVRCCGHCLVANSVALNMLGITADTPAPDGGRIGIDCGAPDGRFFDNAMDIIYAALPSPDAAEIKDMIRAGCRALNAYGITGCHSDDYSVFSNVPWQTIYDAFRELEKSGELTVRVYEQSNFSDLESLREFCEAGNITGTGGKMFKNGPLKLLGDGALGARTAFLSVPYADEPGTRGIPVFSQEKLNAMIGYAHEMGMQCAVHAIGDACLDRVLEAYEKALLAHPRADHRHGIVHCQITRADQLKKMIDMRLHIYAQTIFLDYDSGIVRARVGDALAGTSYRWKTLMRGGASVSNGSDCPVENPDVMRGIQCAVTRTNIDGGTAYLPEEAFTVAEALNSFTIRSAEASFDENTRGYIRSGMQADFVVLDKSPFDTPAYMIKDINVCATFLGGTRVY